MLLQALQRGDAVTFLKRRRVFGYLGGVELDLFWIFFGLDFDEAAFDRLFDRFSQIFQRADLFTVHPSSL